MKKKLSGGELDKLVKAFEEGYPNELLARAQEEKESLVELFGEKDYGHFRNYCTELVKAYLGTQDPPPGVDDNMMWGAMLQHNMRSMLHRAAEEYRKGVGQ